MLLNFYKNRSNIWQSCGTLQVEVQECLNYIKDNIYADVADPKGIEGNINRLEKEVQDKIYERVTTDLENIRYGNYHEDIGEKDQAFEYWENVFGSFFPAYG